MPRQSLIILFLFAIAMSATAQMPGVTMAKGQKRIDIPFEWRDNFIVLRVSVSGLLPLKFILDTGAEHTILLKKDIATLLNIPFERTITLTGTDMQSAVKAHIARKVSLDLPNLKLTKDILVLEEDYIKLDQFSGLEIQGILGAEIFRGYVLKIDYEKQLLTMYEPSAFKPAEHRKFQELPIEIFRSKPYIMSVATVNGDTSTSLKLLLDTGAALSILLHTYATFGLSLPQKVIKGKLGTGFSGIVEGYIGRVKQVDLAGYQLTNAIANFQELPDSADTFHLNGRHGLIGSEILSRFIVIIDFANEKLYLKANAFFKDEHIYDRSGMTLIAHGIGLKQFLVYDVMPNTPAAEAEILRGDEILKINGFPAKIFDLSTITKKMQNKVGKKIRLTILRNGQKLKKEFKLRELI